MDVREAMRNEETVKIYNTRLNQLANKINGLGNAKRELIKEMRKLDLSATRSGVELCYAWVERSGGPDLEVFGARLLPSGTKQ